MSPRTAGQPRVPSDPSPIHLGQLVDPAGPRTQTQVSRDSWSTPEHSELPGTSGRHCEAAGRVPSCPGQLIHPTCPQARPQVSREAWSTPRGLGYSPESPGTPGRHRGPSDQGPSHLGQLVNTAGHRAWAQDTRDSRSTQGPQTRTRVTRQSWSTPRALVHRPESPWIAGRTCGTSVLGPNLSRPLVEPGGPRTQA